MPILVDAGQVLAPVSTLLFGQNVGISPDTSPPALKLYQQIGVTLLRFPGGNFGDENDLLLIVPAQRWSWLWFGAGVVFAMFIGTGLLWLARRRKV